MSKEIWPPPFTLDQENILNLLTGDRFYSNPSAALREAVLNAIDAVHRRRRVDTALAPEITVVFNLDDKTLTVADNGVGMSRSDVSALFAKVGASAASSESKKDSVGEFGIGVISYFMASNSFELQTYDGKTEPIGLLFKREMLAGGSAVEISPMQKLQGTTVIISVKDEPTLDNLIDGFPHWCRDVEGLNARIMPENRTITQGGSHRANIVVKVAHPEWVERSHLGPVSDPTGWEAMTGISTISVLYRGVFVQEVEIKGVWGIEGSIDVDPKHFKPRLNRESFVESSFKTDVEAFLRGCHPSILEAMAIRLKDAVDKGELDKWTETRWASLWLSVPRDAAYASAVTAWDNIFWSLPAFECTDGDKWKPISMEQLRALEGDIFVAPMAQENPSDIVRAALHFLRGSNHSVIRGIRRDNTWMKYAVGPFGTTADLISSVFSDELPAMLSIAGRAEEILSSIDRVAPLFTGPPQVDIVRLGSDSSPVIRIKNRLLINTDHLAGAAIVRDALNENSGPTSLIALAARHARKQLSEVAAAVLDASTEPEILSPIRRRVIRQHLP